MTMALSGGTASLETNTMALALQQNSTKILTIYEASTPIQ